MTSSDAPVEVEAPEEPATTFSDLGLEGAVLKALDDVGYETPSAIQAATIPRSSRAATSSASPRPAPARPRPSRCRSWRASTCTQKSPQALVLAPTRELALQVCEAFERYAAHLRGVHILPVYGGQGYGVQLSALRRGVHIIVGTPGRIMDHLDKGTLDLSELKYLVLDEADEMLKMGFAEDVETILADTPDDKQVALFSATMPAAIRRMSKQYLHDPEEITVKTKTQTSANITQRYLVVSYAQKVDALTRILEVENFEGMIVFVRTKNVTEELAEKLRARGYSAAAINGDIDQVQRERTVNQLKSGKLDILVATDVAARGLDVERISHVVNFDIPTDSEPYVHRIGRTGRAGRTGDAISFVTPRERGLLARIEKATRQPLVEMRLPSVDDVNVTRLARFDDRITAALDQGDRVEGFRDIIAHYMRHHDVPEVDVAAALAIVAQGESPLLLEPEPERPAARSASDSTATTAIVADAATGATAVGPNAPAASAPSVGLVPAPSRWPRTASPSADGTRSSRARSSAPSRTRAASARRLRRDPDPARVLARRAARRPARDTLDRLSGTRISGRLIELRPDRGGPPRRTDAAGEKPFRKPRHKN